MNLALVLLPCLRAGRSSLLNGNIILECVSLDYAVYFYIDLDCVVIVSH